MFTDKIKPLTAAQVIEQGIPFDEDTFSYEFYWKGNKNYYDQLFDKPMDEGGNPVNGLIYGLYPDGSLNYYTFYKDGFQCGDDVCFYPNGGLSRFSRYTDSENYIYEWHENGRLKMFLEHHRRDNPYFQRYKEFDENGNITIQRICCEIDYTHNYNSPNGLYEVSWHNNGEFKKIIINEPTESDFYTEIEFDESGYLIDFNVNPHYYPEFYSIEKQSHGLNFFDSSYHFYGDILKRDSNNFSGKTAFLYGNGEVEKIMNFKNGQPYADQYFYYKSGKLKEFYCIENGREYSKHICWYEGGTVRRAVIYSRDGLHRYEVSFSENGEVTSKIEV